MCMLILHVCAYALHTLCLRLLPTLIACCLPSTAGCHWILPHRVSSMWGKGHSQGKVEGTASADFQRLPYPSSLLSASEMTMVNTGSRWMPSKEYTSILLPIMALDSQVGRSAWIKRRMYTKLSLLCNITVQHYCATLRHRYTGRWQAVCVFAKLVWSWGPWATTDWGCAFLLAWSLPGYKLKDVLVLHFLSNPYRAFPHSFYALSMSIAISTKATHTRSEHGVLKSLFVSLGTTKPDSRKSMHICVPMQ